MSNDKHYDFKHALLTGWISSPADCGVASCLLSDGAIVIYWPDILLAKIIRPAARRAGIKKRIGWHTFRHTFSTLLVANAENVKVVQELMPHSNSRCTLDTYSQAQIAAKREAQQRIVQMILPKDRGRFCMI
jgi:integrase